MAIALNNLEFLSEERMRERRRRPYPSAGFTIVELLVVTSIFGLLIALLLPAVQSARAAARRGQCLSHLRQLGVALTLFHDAAAQYPPARIEYRRGDLPSRICGGLEPTWFAYVLPYVEEAAAADNWRLLEPYSIHSDHVRSYAPIIFACPARGPIVVSKNTIRSVNLPCGCGGPIGSGPVGAAAHYAGNHGDLTPGFSGSDEDFYWGGRGTGVLISVRARCGGFYPPYPAQLYDRVRDKDITDGHSKTFLVGELHVTPEEVGIVPDNGPMYDGQMLPSSARLGGPGMPLSNGIDDRAAGWLFDRHSNYGFGSWHAGVCNFVSADGSARAVSNDLDENVLGFLCNRSDAAVVTTDR